MFLVGLSGGIASGKSSVIQVFRDLGCAVIDADDIAHQVVKPGFPAYYRIVQAFGHEILLENGEINRQALGSIIFHQSEKRKLLNAITHPDIRKEMLKQVLKYLIQGYRYVILDIPLLFETKTMLRFMKHTVVVYCDPQTQLSRLMERNGLSQEEAEARIAAQLPLEEKRQLAQHILDNSGEWEVTRRQTLRLHSQLEDSLDFLPLRLGLFAGFVGIIYLFSRHFLL
ncbi:dephospho-CoA kinase domain-containing protein [Monodelphis domestica]|uniref:Dephospho-CoA kinase domain-containing protein n=1 Tax=Monodelphis domestica TaxID=13616 RepID=F6RMS8_MONDO|nr:dephospho-CoA kinase domain-containing protein [Monodelphis domestica]XP_007482529.1 dephospho-CoA kinase domain-containing protein [Monodelphis domestica]XP_007482530.1 dephospho-CoA kinase domain-containing protein [Monodelphis domestica]XP_016286052.1 dephospho-CoA kinase domain-containing protein [Monodelphis domestica]XP_016286053.1 dephospho-CoA kinase domain-containing protein [Monodelphis domestica]XP_056672964.1 dephospho-CoA kinase domain-containing protein [Monodelphis domestica]